VFLAKLLQNFTRAPDERCEKLWFREIFLTKISLKLCYVLSLGCFIWTD